MRERNAYRDALASADQELADPATIAALEATLPPQHTRYHAENGTDARGDSGQLGLVSAAGGDYAGSLERRRRRRWPSCGPCRPSTPSSSSSGRRSARPLYHASVLELQQQTEGAGLGS